MFKLSTILFTLLFAAQAWAETGDTKYLYRIYYRSGSQGEWQEAIEAGSPVTSEDKAIEIAKLVREKFDHGGLAAFEVEVRKFKIVTRPATEEEQQAFGDSYAGATAIAGTTTTIITPPAHRQDASHSDEPAAGHHGPASNDSSAAYTPSRPLAVDPPADVSVPMVGGSQPSQPTMGKASAGKAPASQAGSSAVGKATAGKPTSSPGLTMNEGASGPKVQTNTRVVIGAGVTTPSDEPSAGTTAQANKLVGKLEDLIARLKRENSSSTTEGQPVAVPAAGPITSLDPDFFQGIPAPAPIRPAVARRLRVIRNGQLVTSVDYDVNGTRIDTRPSGSTASNAQPAAAAEQGSGGGRPEAELKFDENAPRGGQTPSSADQEQAAALQKDREMLTKLQTDLNAKKSNIDQETKRLDDERTSLDREKESLGKRGQELKSREAQLARPSLEGRTASGREGSKDRMTIQFESGGRVIGTDSSGTHSGTWSQSGNSVTFHVVDSTFTGTISGNSMSGSRSRSDGLNDSWNLTLSSGPASSSELRQNVVGDRRQLEVDQAAHDGRQKAHQQANEQVRSSRLRFQAEQGRYEDAFARHRQQTLEFNNRPGR